MDTKKKPPERRRSSRLGRGSTAPTSSGPTTSSSSNATAQLDSKNAGISAASTSKPAANGRQGKKRATTKSTTGGRSQQAKSQHDKLATQPATASKRRKLSTTKRSVTPSPVAPTNSSLKSPPVKGKSIKEALRQESKQDDNVSTPVNRTLPDGETPPEGVFDLEAMAASQLELRTVANSHFSLEPYGSDDNNSFFVSYGRQYYKHLFNAAETLRDSLIGENDTMARATRANIVGASSAMALPRCLSRQEDISTVMRAILVDWLAELAHSFKLQDMTLHLSVKLLDRVLCKMSIERRMFQCLGCACMLIASKLEETQPVTTKDLAYMSDSTYTRSQIKDMEVKVCDLLEFRLQTPTAYHFSDRFIRASNATAGLCRPSPHNPILETMVSYFMELALLEHGLVEKPCSLVAAAAVFLARATLGIRDAQGQIWNETLKFYTSYDLEDLEDTVLTLHACQRDADQTNLKCIVAHYKHKDRYEVGRKPALMKNDLGFDDTSS